MKARDHDKFIEAVRIELNGKRMGNSEPIPIDKVPKGDQAHRHGLVYAMQVTNQDARSLQMEGMPQCPWRTTRTWCSLLGHLCPGGDMANGEILPNPVHPPRLAQSPTRFCHGVSASTGRNATLHVITPGLQAKWNDKKDPCSQVDMQCLWLETSWQGLEQIHGPGHV